MKYKVRLFNPTGATEFIYLIIPHTSQDFKAQLYFILSKMHFGNDFEYMRHYRFKGIYIFRKLIIFQYNSVFKKEVNFYMF